MDNDEVKYLFDGSLLGTFFGLLRYAQDFTTIPRPAFAWWIWGIKGATAGAVGLLATLIPLEFHWPLSYGVIFIALAGWGGVETINAAKEAMFDAIKRYVNARGPGGAGDRAPPPNDPDASPQG